MRISRDLSLSFIWNFVVSKIDGSHLSILSGLLCLRLDVMGHAFPLSFFTRWLMSDGVVLWGIYIFSRSREESYKQVPTEKQARTHAISFVLVAALLRFPFVPGSRANVPCPFSKIYRRSESF